MQLGTKSTATPTRPDGPGRQPKQGHVFRNSWLRSRDERSDLAGFRADDESESFQKPPTGSERGRGSDQHVPRSAPTICLIFLTRKLRFHLAGKHRPHLFGGTPAAFRLLLRTDLILRRLYQWTKTRQTWFLSRYVSNIVMTDCCFTSNYPKSKIHLSVIR